MFLKIDRFVHFVKISFLLNCGGRGVGRRNKHEYYHHYISVPEYCVKETSSLPPNVSVMRTMRHPQWLT